LSRHELLEHASYAAASLQNRSGLVVRRVHTTEMHELEYVKLSACPDLFETITWSLVDVILLLLLLLLLLLHKSKYENNTFNQGRRPILPIVKNIAALPNTVYK
jgi:hypothetical protein